MTWEYRVIHNKKTNVISIHEVYHDEDDEGKELISVTAKPSWPQGESGEEFIEDLKFYLRALALPVLDYDDLRSEAEMIRAVLEKTDPELTKIIFPS